MDAGKPNRAATIRLRVPCVGISVPGDEVLDDPVLAAVIVEDHRRLGVPAWRPPAGRLPGNHDRAVCA
jgi:hypothetical protein